jgi:acetyl esterase/lipase
MKVTTLFVAVLLGVSIAGAETEKGTWVDISESVTSKVEQKWPGLAAGIAVDPASGEVYMVISGAGLWKSKNRGATFERVDGGNVEGRCETGAAISVDPMGGGRLAFFQLDGSSAWTPDGGKTWRPCNDRSRGFDFVAVDWTDPRARRMFGVRHESGEVGLLSDDAGATWKVLDKGFKSFGVFDFDTLVTSRGDGISRSTDGGATWAKVSDVNPTGRVMVLYGGAGYWLHDQGILVSKDRGATWTSQGSAVSAWFGPYFGKDEKHMVVVGKAGFQETTDGGATWKVVAPAPDVKDFNGPWYSNYAWDWNANIFYASRMGKPAYKLERAGSEGPRIVDVWPGAPPDESGDIGPERFRMSPELDRTQVEVTESTRMVTDVTRPTLTIHAPPKDRNTGAAVLICPGGGYWNLYWQLEGEEVAAWLNSLGVTGIILKYRVPRRPDEPRGEPARRPLQDAQRAVSLVRSRASDWGIDPDRIGMAGFSAGGHLAIATATSFEKRTYEPIDDVDGVSCRPDFAILVYPGYLKAKDRDALAPGLAIPAGTPPVFLAHGGDDIISSPEHSVVLYLALKQAKVPAELHVYAGATHDFGVRASGQPCSTWTESCARWLGQRFLQRPLRK